MQKALNVQNHTIQSNQSQLTIVRSIKYFLIVSVLSDRPRTRRGALVAHALGTVLRWSRGPDSRDYSVTPIRRSKTCMLLERWLCSLLPQIGACCGWKRRAPNKYTFISALRHWGVKGEDRLPFFLSPLLMWHTTWPMRGSRRSCLHSWWVLCCRRSVLSMYKVGGSSPLHLRASSRWP